MKAKLIKIREYIATYACETDCWADSTAGDGSKFCHNEARGRECGKIGRSALALINELLAELGSQTPDYVYNADNWEVTYHDMDMLQDELGYRDDKIMRVGRLSSLPDQYMVCVTDQETDESEYKTFDSLEEAQAAISAIKGDRL